MNAETLSPHGTGREGDKAEQGLSAILLRFFYGRNPSGESGNFTVAL